MKKKNKKIQIDKESRQKMLDELKKKGIEIKDDDKISGGFVESAGWLETPLKDDEKSHL
jgi:hypothetical protein